MKGIQQNWLWRAGLVGLCFGFFSGQAGQVERRVFGETESGRTVHLFRLTNDRGLSVELIEFGATIKSLHVPDQHGTTKNVVAGAEALDSYLRGFPAASVIGRFANRIAGASYPLDGVQKTVTANAGKNHIHGGRRGFAKVIWTGEVAKLDDGSVGVRFSYHSKDGEEGFPGDLAVDVTYSLSEENRLRIHYQAEGTKPTPINLTNHAYFNLAESGGFRDHVLWLDARFYTPADRQLIPTGEIASVEGSPLDFTQPLAIGARIGEIPKPPGTYDHNYVLNKPDGELAQIAKVVEPVSGRVMDVFTTEPGVQLYTGNPRGFCLETQHYPDSPNKPHFPSTILRPGKKFESITDFRFSVVK